MYIIPKRHSSCRSKTRDTSQGFTTVELMITMSVIAILISLAAPSFNRVIRDNRVLSEANSLIAAVANARSEAMRRGRMVSICPSSNGASCGANWTDGWLVYVEKTTVVAGAAPDIDMVLLVGDGAEALQINQTVGNSWIRFGSRGLAEQAVTLEVRPETCNAGYNFQRLAFGVTGRPSMTKQTC